MREPLCINGVEVFEENGEHYCSVAGELRVIIGGSVVVNGRHGHATRHIYDRTTDPRVTTVWFRLS